MPSYVVALSCQHAMTYKTVSLHLCLVPVQFLKNTKCMNNSTVRAALVAVLKMHPAPH